MLQGDQAECKEINTSKGEQQPKTFLLSVMPESHKLCESEQHRKVTKLSAKKSMLPRESNSQRYSC
eukprot:4599908-Ditylum_brightwellii.AAC.1